MQPELTRRELLRALGISPLGNMLARPWSFEEKSLPALNADDPRHRKLVRPITCVVAGAGNRGNVYARYALRHPDEMTVVGVAEPIELRRARFVKKFAIDPKFAFTTWEHIFERGKFADVVVVTTPDHLHTGPALRAVEQGYDVLLEKAIAQTWDECVRIHAATRRFQRIVGVCHVLRYSPYFRKMKQVVDSGVLGRLVSVQHFEPVQHVHMAHSFVRGNWRNASESNPILLSKSCHDLDLLRWIVDRPSRRIASFGGLTWFRRENAPEGSTARCTDGCKVEPECPYSALRIYHRDRKYLGNLDLPEQGDVGPAILERLKHGRYGRCVYRCDNDVFDHQIVSIEFEDGITASFSLEAFTDYGGRRTRLMGSMGHAHGDESVLYVANFKTAEITKWVTAEAAEVTSGHGGGDFGLVRDFLQAVAQRDSSLLSSTLEASLESHLMAFRAEQARKKGTAETIQFRL